jgi:hypothetical protein
VRPISNNATIIKTEVLTYGISYVLNLSQSESIIGSSSHVKCPHETKIMYKVDNYFNNL